MGVYSATTWVDPPQRQILQDTLGQARRNLRTTLIKLGQARTKKPMIMNTQTATSSASGCPGTRDGDIGGVAHPAAVCPQASSLNRANSAESEGLRTVGSHSHVNDSVQSLNQTHPNRGDRVGEAFVRRKKVPKGQKMVIASLNIKGKLDHERKSKYKRLATLIRQRGYTIMAIQETKLKDGDAERLNKENPRIIISSSDLDGVAGVAFVLNKDMISGKQYSIEEWIPGRAIAMKTNISEDQEVLLVNVYAPNIAQQKRTFLTELKDKLKEARKENKHIILMGDFNMVEDVIDRLPMSDNDDSGCKEVLRELKRQCQMIDGWREENPDSRGYTFTQKDRGEVRLARLDRIYVTNNMAKQAVEWEIEGSANLSDHEVVSCAVLKTGLPYIGNGKWKMKESALGSNKALKELHDILKVCEREMEEDREKGPQQIWEETKEKLKKTAKRIEKDLWLTKNRALITQREKVEETIIKAKDMTQSGDIGRKARQEIMEARLEENTLLERNLNKMSWKAKARYEMKGEKGTKYWFALNKAKNEQQAIIALERKDGTLATETSEMVQIASKHHASLQEAPKREDGDNEKIQKVIDEIKVELREEEKETMDKPFEKLEIRQTIKEVENGVAPGDDGIPYEFYKKMLERESIQTDDEYKGSISGILQKVYNSIKKDGLKTKSFNKGVMFLLYKKKARTKIENYRPVTLTNSDYKIMTKMIATRLGEVVKGIIHPDQAGFVPGRSLYDNVRLTEYMVSYSREFEENGCIVALDQEKAYDKIAHDYLWRVLEKFGFPPGFIRMVKEIYKNAETSVMVNGVKPKPIAVSRGVRQGCPMSCLLYNLAIEPLAIMLRNSKLKGFKINGTEDPVKVTLFADDTIVYMRQDDDFRELNKVLDRFCEASTAKFNLEKTEFLPIGTKEHRQEVIKERRLNKLPGNQIEAGMTIIEDGTSMRTLGAWIGNETNQEPQWNKIMEEQEKRMDLWGKMNLSLKGKELILKAIVQSKAIFLATVNGISNRRAEEMNKKMRRFLWSGKKGAINWTRATLPREDGGLNVPDMKARIDAINIMWLKKMASPPNERPRWAWVADEIIKKNANKEVKLEESSKVDWVLQTWKESKAKWARIPQSIRSMIEVGRRYNMGLDVQKASQELREQLPVWYHVTAEDKYLDNKKAARCLRNNHGIKTVGDLRWDTGNQNCQNAPACAAMKDALMSRVSNKMNPTLQTPRKDGLDMTPRTKKKEKSKDLKSEGRRVDPNVTETGHPREAIRIFTKGQKYITGKEERLTTRPARRMKGSRHTWTVSITVKKQLSHDGSTIQVGIARDGTTKSTEGYYFKYDGNVEGGEILAIREQIEAKGEITIRTQNKRIIEVLTDKLEEIEDSDWVDMENVREWKSLVSTIRRKGNAVHFEWITKDTRTHLDETAKREMEREDLQMREPNHKTYNRFIRSGARLSSLTQKMAYKLVIREREQKERTRREKETEGTRREMGWDKSSERTVRTSLWKGPFTNKHSDFIWKIRNDRVKCGKFFMHMPGWEDKAYCTCGDIESVEHIVLKCRDNRCEEAWNMAGQLWERAHGKENFKKPTIATIEAIPVVTIRKDGKESKEMTEMYKVLIMETVWALWCQRNRRIFDNSFTTGTTTGKLVLDKINDRVTIDIFKLKLSDAWHVDKEKTKAKWGSLVREENNELVPQVLP